MKAFLFEKILKLLFVSFSVFSIAGCQENVSIDDGGEHIHSFSQTYNYNEEYHWHDSTCGHDVIDGKEKHIFSDWIIDKDATYESEGLKHQECEICNYIKEESIPKLTIDLEFLEMPIFVLDTENHQSITSKEVYVKGNLNILNAGEYNDYDLSLGIRGRGNYSWSGTEKKSYRIKFDKKYQPLGQGKGKAKSWTLLAVHCDKSMLRTDGAFHFASYLNNLPFVSSSSFVELYLNNKYQGVYELCDQIQVNPNRVDIDDSGEEDDIGYLVELDKNASENAIKISTGESFEIKSDFVNISQKNFIKNYLDKCSKAIISGEYEKVDSLINILSMVDAYLVEELFKNLDVGWGSFYYTKPKGEKLSFGPVWDFDLCAGNADSDNYDSAFPSYKYTYVGNDYFDYMQQHTWYKALRKCDWFNELISERWEEVKNFASETVTYISEQAESQINSFKRNFARWKIFNKKINREPTNIMAIKSFTGQVDFLTDWLTKRIDWLDKYYHNEVEDIKTYYY